MEFTNQEAQKKLLGPFNSSEHEFVLTKGGIGQNVIDMTLQPSLLGEKRELALKFKQSIISSDTKHYLVIGVMGEGKTSFF